MSIRPTSPTLKRATAKRVTAPLAALGLAAAGLTLSAPAAEASERWRFDRERGGGVAESCGVFDGERLCVAVYCGRGVDGLEVGLTGWEPRGRGDRRRGAIEVDGRGRQATYLRENEPVIGDIWRLEMGRGERRLIERMKAGWRLSVDIAARGPAYDFTLAGSRRAIERLEQRCSRQARRDVDHGRQRRDDRADRAPDRPGEPVIRFGDENFGITLRFGTDGDDDGDRHRDRAPRHRFGPDWERIGSARVDRRRDRDVIRIGRDAGRFDALRLRALDNDVRIRRVRVHYGNGQSQSVNVDRRIGEGEASNVIELRGRRGRAIEQVELVYDTQSRGPRAELEVWGQTS